MTAPSCQDLLQHADRLLDAGRPAVAALLLDAVEAAPHDIAASTLRRARAHLALGDPQAAIRAVDEAAGATLPAALLVWRARARLATGDTSQALTDSAEATRRAPADPAAAGLYATMLIEQGQAAIALGVLETAIGLGARDAALHVALALALLAMHEPAAARTAIMRGLAQHPRHQVLRRLLPRTAPTPASPA
jgi:predicted Zn-dependent protease